MFPNSTYRPHRQAAFTLVEMLVVFVVIAVLIGILVPVIAGAYRHARQAAEVVEINNLVTALEQFKSRFGHYPPSQMILREDGDYIVGGAPFYPPPASRQDAAVFIEDISVQYLNLFWPELVIHKRTGGPANPVTPVEIGDINGDGSIDSADFYDWNGDGALNGPWFLQGDECLIFFLGGIPTGQFVNPSGATVRPGGVGANPKAYPPGVMGFSKTPKWPSQAQVPGSAASGRDGPFYEFDSGRMVDRDMDGYWELLPLRKPHPTGGYAYFSAYSGAGYRPDDLNFLLEGTGDSTVPNVGYLEFRVRWARPTTYPAPPPMGSYPAYSGQPPTSIYSPGPNPYTIGPPMVDATATDRYWKPEAFQIISPGPDGNYGQGGAVERLGPNNTGSRPNAPNYQEVPADEDNLSNFATKDLGDVTTK